MMVKTGTMAVAAIAAGAVHSAGIDAEYVAVNERVLVDGNVIKQTAVGRFAQDDRGRTRFEMDGRTSIVDPVEGIMWTIDDRFNRAYRVDMADSSAFPTADDDTGSIGDLAAAGLSAVAAPPDRPPENREVENLGTEVVNGMVSTGELHRQTIPAGQWVTLSRSWLRWRSGGPATSALICRSAP